MVQQLQNRKKIILDLCGGAGSWSDPYKKAGYDVYVITLPKYDVTKYGMTKETITFYQQNSIHGCLTISLKNIYGILAAPPCTKFSKANWRIKKVNRDFTEGMICVRSCLDIIWGLQERGAPLEFWALENPMGYLYNFLGLPAYYFQPWMFGEKGLLATKRTALWGYFNLPTRSVKTRNIPFVQTHSQNRDAKSLAIEINRQWGSMSREDRARTPKSFAKAFFKANQ